MKQLPKKACRLDDSDFRNAEKALLRAAKKALEPAKRFGHGVFIYENGEIIEEQSEADSKDFL